jgi:SdrD B-like domain
LAKLGTVRLWLYPGIDETLDSREIAADTVSVKRRILIIVGALVAVFLGAQLAFAFSPDPPAMSLNVATSKTSVLADESWSYNVQVGCVVNAESCKDAQIFMKVPVGAEVVTPPSVGSSAEGSVTSSIMTTNALGMSVGPGTFTVNIRKPIGGDSLTLLLVVKAPKCVAPGQPQPSAPASTFTSASSNAGAPVAAVASVSIGTIPECTNVVSCSTNPCTPDPLAWHAKGASDAAAGTSTTWSIQLAERGYDYEVIDTFGADFSRPAFFTTNDIWANDDTKMLVRCGSSPTWLPLDRTLANNPPAECLVGATQVVKREFPAVKALKIRVKAHTKPVISLAQWVPETYTSPSGTSGGDPVQADDTFKNCAIAFEAPPDVSSFDTKFCATLTVLPKRPIPTPRISIVASPLHPLGGRDPGFGIPAAESSNPMGEKDLAFWASLRLDRSGARDLKDPVLIVDLTPDQTFQRDPDSTINDKWLRQATWQKTIVTDRGEANDPAKLGCKNPEFDLVDGDIGGQRLRWTFKGCTLSHDLPYDPEIGVFFSTHINPIARADKDITSMFWIGAYDGSTPLDMAKQGCEQSRQDLDSGDADGDKLRNDKLCFGNAAGHKVPSFGKLSGTTVVKGGSDPDFFTDPVTGATKPFDGYEYPASGHTDDVSSPATYTIEIVNTGTIPVDSVDFVSILPYPGDKAIGPTESSDWNMKLAGPGVVERLDAAGNATPAPKSEFKIGYSNDQNPCRFDASKDSNGNTPAGRLLLSGAPFPVRSQVTLPSACPTSPWVKDFPAGSAYQSNFAQTSAPSINSVAVEFNPAKANRLNPGEGVRVTFDVVRDGPLPAKKNGVAWTRMAFSGVNDGGIRMATSAPRIGGVRIADKPSVSGVVWNDITPDGLRDVDAEPLMPGVLVTAIDNTTNLPAGSATTDDKGGYFITGLTPGRSYTVRFGPAGLVGYEPTLYGQGVGPSTSRQSLVRKNGTFFEITSAVLDPLKISGGLDAGFIGVASDAQGTT